MIKIDIVEWIEYTLLDFNPVDKILFSLILDEFKSNGSKTIVELCVIAVSKHRFDEIEFQLKRLNEEKEKLAKILGENQAYWG